MDISTIRNKEDDLLIEYDEFDIRARYKPHAYTDQDRLTIQRVARKARAEPAEDEEDDDEAGLIDAVIPIIPRLFISWDLSDGVDANKQPIPIPITEDAIRALNMPWLVIAISGAMFTDMGNRALPRADRRKLKGKVTTMPSPATPAPAASPSRHTVLPPSSTPAPALEAPTA